MNDVATANLLKRRGAARAVKSALDAVSSVGSSPVNPARVIIPPTDGYDLAYAFPDIDSGLEPFGNRVIVQIRAPRTHTKSGLLLPAESQDTDKWNTQVAKVRAIGPVAFMSRSIPPEPWPEGRWFKVGDYIRVPLHGGDAWEVKVPGRQEPVLFKIFIEKETLGKIQGDPLAVLSYID